MIINELHIKTNHVLLESCNGLQPGQRKIVEGIFREFRPIIEATLTTQQIDQLFRGVEQGATAGGANRTLIGKGVDAASAVNQAINNVGKWLQNTAPVQAFDQKFEQLKSTIGQKFPGLEKNLSAMGAWARENPGKTAAIIGVLTTIAALGAGPAGGAIAGQILRGTSELLQGQKLSTAVGKGVKTAALGALAGWTIGKVSELVSGGMRQVASNFFPGARKVELIFRDTSGGGTFQSLDAIGRADDVQAINNTWNQGIRAWEAGRHQQALQLWDQSKQIAAKMADPAYAAQLTQDQNIARSITAGAKNLMAASDKVAAVAQGALAGAGEGGARKTTAESQATHRRPVDRKLVDRDATLWQWQLNESLGLRNRSLCLSSQGIDHVFRLIEQELKELDVKGARAQDVLARRGKVSQRPTAQAPITPAAQQPAAQQPAAAPQQPGIMSRIGQGLSSFGRQLTTKVTTEKLNKAWKAAGSPTDSDKIFALIIKQGVPDTVVRQVYTDLNIAPPSGSAAASAASPARTTVPYAPPVDTVTAPTDASTAAGTDKTSTSSVSLSPPVDSDSAAAGTETGTKTAGDAGAAASSTASGSSQSAKMTADDIVGQIKPIWDKITANQDNPIGAPAVKQLIKSMWMAAGGTKVAESRRKNKKKVDENIRWAIDHVRQRQKILSGQRPS